MFRPSNIIFQCNDGSSIHSYYRALYRIHPSYSAIVFYSQSFKDPSWLLCHVANPMESYLNYLALFPILQEYTTVTFVLFPIFQGPIPVTFLCFDPSWTFVKFPILLGTLFSSFTALFYRVPKCSITKILFLEYCNFGLKF